MPTFTAKTPTIAREFAGHAIAVPAVYVGGHILTADEAHWLNGQVATVVGNAFGGTLRRNDGNLPEGYIDAQTLFNDIFADYTLAPSTRGTGASKPKSDPIASLARSFAEADLIAKIEAKGLEVRKFRTTKEADGRTSFTRLLDAQFEKGKEDYLDRAREMFADAADAATDDDDDLDFTLPEPATD